MNKGQLKQDIEAMKAKLASMEEELNKEQEFKWNYTKDKVYKIYNTYVGSESLVSFTHQYYGNYRLYKRNASMSLKTTRETKIIGALAEQVNPDETWVPDWEDHKQYKQYIVYSHQDNSYKVVATTWTRVPGVHYMSSNTALKVCKILNSGQVKL